MQPQALLSASFFLFIALFLREVVVRMTRLLPQTEELRYFDFVRNTLFSCVRNEVFRIVVFSLVYGISNIPWLLWVWIYFESLDKIVVLDFPYFLVHFWLMLFIAFSVFVMYWVFGLVSLGYYECARVQGKKMTYSYETYRSEARNKQRWDWRYYRLRPWFILFLITLIPFLWHLSL